MFPTSFEHKLHKKRDGNFPLLRFNFRSSGWEPTILTPRLHSDHITDFLKFYIPIHKVLQ